MPILSRVTRFAGFLRRRPPFTLALVGLVVLLTGLTGTVIGGLAWREQRARSRALLDAAMAQAARLTAAHTARVFEDAESTVRLGPLLVEQRQLDVGAAAAVERYVLAALRANPHVSWVSYADRQDAFVGAWRDARGHVYVNRSFPVGERIHLEEDRMLPEGGRETVRRSTDHKYRPTERPYFRLAEARRTVVWTEPYEFYAGGGLGITCAAPLLDDAGRVRGVFTVDFSLDRLAGALEALEVSPRGRVFIATGQGTVVIGRRGSGASRAEIIDAELAAATVRRAPLEKEATFEFDHHDERYLGRAVPLAAGDLKWLVEVVVPERDYTEQIDAEGRLSVLLGVVALGIALLGGIAVASWIAHPLRELAQVARRIRHGQLDVTAVPRSRDEIGVLARAMNDMARALRDRDFIRETLGRYVSPELAAQVLRDPEALQLGGEVRDVAMLMSDLRGFSELSERLGPSAMIGLLNRYLAAMTPVIQQHRGVIDEFIGDAIFVLFGAPFGRPDDAERAVRCAAAMQEALAALNADSSTHGLPELTMGIGLHVGPVVAGNIGSPDRVKYGVVGPAVNLTARIQALTAGGEVLLSEALLARVSALVSVAPGRQERVKGSSEPITVHRLLAVKAPPADPAP
ncbi:MAG: HAMP domain-containing protein [Candidatus Rokuibacteriota bacterium]|nr:MAG: HAMP domain-containing protein [Candidatus Rokubacteria bacterium]